MRTKRTKGCCKEMCYQLHANWIKIQTSCRGTQQWRYRNQVLLFQEDLIAKFWFIQIYPPLKNLLWIPQMRDFSSTLSIHSTFYIALTWHPAHYVVIYLFLLNCKATVKDSYCVCISSIQIKAWDEKYKQRPMHFSPKMFSVKKNDYSLCI